jgi:hypothetical protein
VAVIGQPKCPASVTLIWLFLNISIHSCTTLQEEALSPYWAHMRWWICLPGTPSAHKIISQIVAPPRCNSLVLLPWSPLGSNSHTNCKDNRLALTTSHMKPYNTPNPTPPALSIFFENIKVWKLFEDPS